MTTMWKHSIKNVWTKYLFILFVFTHRKVSSKFSSKERLKNKWNKKFFNTENWTLFKYNTAYAEVLSHFSACSQQSPSVSTTKRHCQTLSSDGNQSATKKRKLTDDYSKFRSCIDQSPSYMCSCERFLFFDQLSGKKFDHILL